MGWTDHKCRQLIDEYPEDEIMERHEAANRNNPDWPTPAIRLVRTNETAVSSPEGSMGSRGYLRAALKTCRPWTGFAPRRFPPKVRTRTHRVIVSKVLRAGSQSLDWPGSFCES